MPGAGPVEPTPPPTLVADSNRNSAPTKPKPDLEPDPRLAKAKAASDRYRYAEAQRIYEEILADSPGNAEATANLAVTRTARARQVQIVKELLDKGDGYRKERAYSDAIQSFQAALTKDPDSRAAADKLTEAKAAQRRADQAASEILGRSTGSAPPPPQPDTRAQLIRQGKALLDAGLLDDAIATFDGVLKTFPGDAEATAARNRAITLKNQKFQ